MKVVAWPVDETADAETQEINELSELWLVIHQRQEKEPQSGDAQIHEITAREDIDGTPFLVLSWIEVESE